MSKISKLLVGTMLGVCMLVNCVIPCCAATSSITAEITSTKAYGRFIYSQPGHQIKITVYFEEKSNSTGLVKPGSISNVKNGSETTVIAARNNSDGHKYIWGRAFGYVDGELIAMTSDISV